MPETWEKRLMRTEQKDKLLNHWREIRDAARPLRLSAKETEALWEAIGRMYDAINRLPTQ